MSVRTETPDSEETKMLNQITEQMNKLADDANGYANDVATFVNDNRPQRVDDVTGPLAENFSTASNAVLDAVVTSNRRVVEVVVAQADKVRETVAGRVTVDERVADALPTPAEAGARYLEFVERAVAVNREWNDRVVEMIRQGAAQADAAVAPSPVEKAPAKKAPAKKTVAKKTAKKTAAKKTAAKKTAARRTTSK